MGDPHPISSFGTDPSLRGKPLKIEHARKLALSSGCLHVRRLIFIALAFVSICN